MTQNAEQKFLIYIPCWKDYELALGQVSKLQRQLGSALPAKHQNKFNFKFVVSINGVSLTEDQLLEISARVDELIYFDANLGMDTNMNQGFLKAISEKADYYWLLSANDAISENCIEHIVDSLGTTEDLLLFVRSAQRENLKVASVFLKEYAKYPFGLISSVIYPMKVMSEFFPQAMRLNWTGWGQLAVIESACVVRDGISVKTIPENLIFEKSTLLDDYKNRENIRSTYNHSFFGLPILMNSLHQNNPRFRKKLVQNWTLKNWFKFGYFNGHHKPKLFLNSGTNQSWIQETASLIIKNNDFRSRVLFLAGYHINFEKYSSYKPLLKSKRIFLNE